MIPTVESPEFAERYDRMDQANAESFYMTDADRPFTVTMSVHSIGAPREKIDPETQTPEQIEDLKRYNRANIVDADEVAYLKKAGLAARFVLGGNMSTVQQPNGTVPYGPKELTDDERLADAKKNMEEHFNKLGIDPSKVRVLNPERDYSTPLTVVDVDEDDSVFNGNEPVKLKKSGDFIYTYNPDLVLAVRPADCPIAIMAADAPRGRINIMVHFAWRGPASGQFGDMKRELDTLGVDYESLKVYVTPGGHAETYQFKGYVPNANNPEPQEGSLFVDVKKEKKDDGTESYSFGIDTPNDIYQGFLALGLDKKQIFIDTTDTTSLDSGYASHSRAINQREDNVRDLVTAQFHES